MFTNCKRHELQILVEVLEYLGDNGPCNVTKLCCGCNVSNGNGNRYLKSLMDKGLVMIHENGYAATKAGLDFALKFKELAAILYD